MRAGNDDPRGREHNVLLREDGEDLSRVCGRSDGESGDAAAVCDCEQHPSVEKRHQIPVSLAKIDILAARFRKHRSQFGEGNAAEQRNHAPDHPYQQEQHGLRQGAGDVFGSEKNRRADDAADQQQHGVKQAESAHQSRLSRNGLRRCWIFGSGCGGSGVHYPIPSSSGDSSGVPQRRQITEEQSPQVSGSFTSLAQFGQ